MKTLYPVQDEAVTQLEEILHRQGSALNASDTGTGKTLMSVELARRLGIPPLVICPKAVIPSWQRTFDEQGVDYLGIVNYESLRTGNTVFGQWKGEKPTRKNAVDRRPFEWAPEVRLLVADESHRCKSPTSQNSRMLRFAKGGGRMTVFVSATAASNPAEMKVLGYHLGLHNFTDFSPWAKRHGCSLDPWGNLKFTESLKRAKEILVALREEIYPDRGVKVSREDLAEFFTETRVIDDPLDFGDDGKIDALYAEVAEFMAQLEEKEKLDDPHPAAEALIAMLRARQRIELLKVPVIVEMVQEAIAEGMSVPVFLNFNATIQAVQEKLGGSVPVVWGTDHVTRVAQSDVERQQAIDSFQANEENVILLNMEAGGVAISLHDEKGGAPRLALISPTWNEKSLHQVLGRVDRAGAKTDTLQRILYAAGTVEEEVREAMLRKLENLKTLHAAMPPKKKTDPPVQTIVEEPEEPAHAHYSPSSLKYFEICPSYINRTDEDPNPAAEQGTRIHAALEVEDPEALLDEDEIQLGRFTLDQAISNEEEHGVLDGTLHREIKLKIDLHHHLTYGTLDRLRILGRIAVAQDYKFGNNPVDAAEVNAQAWAYSLGIFQQFPEVEVIYFYFLIPKQDEMTFAIFIRHADVEPEAFWEENELAPAATLDEIRLRINLIISRAERDSQLATSKRHYNPQPHVCEFCGFKEDCQALFDKSLLIARQLEPGLQLPKTLLLEEITDSKTFGQLRMIVYILEKWVEGMKKRANAVYRESELPCDGFVWKTKHTSRVINDPLAAFNLLCDSFDFDRGEFMESFFESINSISIEDLEKILKRRAEKGEGEEFAQGAMTLLRDNDILTGGDTEIGFLQIDRTKK